jgi:hypothetical protein
VGVRAADVSSRVRTTAMRAVRWRLPARACRSGRRIIRAPTGISRRPAALTRIQVRSVEQSVMLEDGDEATTGPGCTPCKWASGD